SYASSLLILLVSRHARRIFSRNGQPLKSKWADTTAILMRSIDFSLPSPSLNDLCCGIASTLRLEPEDCILCGLLVSASDCENQQGGKGDQETRRLRGGEPSCETSSAL